MVKSMDDRDRRPLDDAHKIGGAPSSLIHVTFRSKVMVCVSPLPC